MTSTAAADLTKVLFNPSKSVTFVPVAKKQMVMVEVTNNSTSDVAVKFKNTGPTVYKTQPPQAKIGVGEKKMFSCIFKGLPKEQCKSNDRFTVVFIAASKNVVIEKAWKNAHKTATLKHKIAILFQGINDQKEGETQQPTNNEEDNEDKDRQGQMRTKRTEPPKPPAGKKATVVMFMRKEGDSVSDEEDEEASGTPAAAAGAGNDDMKTTLPAGAFNNMQQNAANGPITDDLKTTLPAGPFNNQAAANAAAADTKSDYRTTRPAGAFNNQQMAPAAPSPAKMEQKSDYKTTKPAGAFNGQVAPTAVAKVPEPKSDFKTTKVAGSYENPQTKNK